MTPYLIEGPAVISFSGGRTSGYMLRKILDVGLQPDVHVVFADTGQERPETLQFVRDVEAHWGVPIQWVERPGKFTQLITDKKYLPNPVARFCTQELKLAPMRKWMIAQGHESWTNVVGIRSDEPRRVARLKAQAEKRKERWDVIMPLAEAKVVEQDVIDFWAASPFTINLPVGESNCDICFLKGVKKRIQIIRDFPHLADWWIEQERRIGGTFRHDTPSYAHLAAQQDLFTDGEYDEDIVECFCHD